MTDTADSPLLDYLLAVLASVMAAGLGDAGLARRAAVQAIEAFQPRGTHELIATGQILSFALAALDTLRLSAPPDLSLSMKLRLRGNANGLNRAARDNTRILDNIRQTSTNPADQAAVGQAPASSEPIVAAKAPAQAPAQDWASAMSIVAARLRANTPAATPAQQTVNALWIDALTGVAGEIARGKDPATSSGGCKAALLRTTHLATASLETRPNHGGISMSGVWTGRVGPVTSPTDRLSATYSTCDKGPRPDGQTRSDHHRRDRVGS